MHDTVFAANIFYTFYNEFYFHHELPRWMPFGVFGIPASYWQIAFLTPANYLTGLIGSFFRVRDAILLFKISLWFEELMLLLGIYLLSAELFRKKSVVFFVSLGALISSFWIIQIYWNFRIYYLLPLVFFFLIKFNFEKSEKYFWLSVVTLIFSCYGNPIYFSTFYALLFLISFFFIVKKERVSNLIRPSSSNLPYLAMAVLLAILYVSFVYHINQHLITLAPDRDMVTRRVSLDSFLTHGRSVGWGKFIGLFFPSILSTPRYGDGTLYIGFLPIVFFLYSFNLIKDKRYQLFLILTLFIFFFSLGPATIFARLIFKIFPPIQYFRYIGQTYSILRILILILSGFGFAYFLNEAESKSSAAWRKLFICTGAVILMTLIVDQLNLRYTIYPRQFAKFSYLALAGALIAVMFARFVRNKSSRFHLVFLFFLMFDLFAFNFQAASLWPKKFDWIQKSVLEVYDYEFQEGRAYEEITNPHVDAGLKLKNASGGDLLAVETYNFIQLDVCLPRGVDNPMWLKWTYEFLNKNWPAYFKARSFEEFFKTPNAPYYGAVMGCDSKLYLISNVFFTDELPENVNPLSMINSFYEEITLSNVSDEIRSGWKNTPGPAGKYQVKDFTFNRLLVETQVDVPQAWLYYIDSYHPGWKVFVDHKEKPLVIANSAFKAVHLQQGKHEVKFEFVDTNGLILNVIFVLSALFFAVFMLILFFCILLGNSHLIHFTCARLQ